MSEIETFLQIVRIVSMRLVPLASNVWIYLQPVSSLSKKGKFDACPVTLPKLIYGGQYPDDALALRIEHFWHGRGKKEEMVAFVSRRLAIRPECLHLHKSDGRNYLCVNFSPAAKKGDAPRMVNMITKVPPWIERAVEIFTMRRGLPYDEASIAAAVDKFLALPQFVPIRAAVSVAITESGSGVVSGSGGNGSDGGGVGGSGHQGMPGHLQVDCTLPDSGGSALVSPDSSTPRETLTVAGLIAGASSTVVSPDNSSSFGLVKDNNERLAMEYLSQNQYKLKGVPPSANEKKVAAHILQRSKKELSEKGYVSMPSLRGQSNVAYTRLPTKSEGNDATKKRKVAEVGKLVDAIVEFCGVDQADLIMKQSKKLEDGKIVIILDKLSKEDRRSLGLLMMRIGSLTSHAYHETRMLLIWRFGKEVIHVIGAPLEHLREFRKDIVNTDDMLHGTYLLEVKKGVFKKCHWWIKIRPQDLLASDLAKICNANRYQPCTEFSDGTGEMVFLATNTDGDTDTIAEMARLCDQKSGNSGDRVMMMGQIKDGASETSQNLKTFLLEAPPGLAAKLGLPENDVKKNPLHTFRQATFDDGVVLAQVDILLPEGTTKTLVASFYFKCKDPQNVPVRDRQPDNFPTNLDPLVVSDDKYLRSSSRAMDIDSLDQLRLLTYSDGDFQDVPVAIGAVGADGDITSWGGLMDGQDNSLLDNEGCIVHRVSLKRVIGFSADDTKILCVYCGHLGCSATHHCPKCTHRNDSMANIATSGDPRRGALSHSNSYKIYDELGDAYNEKERRAKSFSIGHEVIYDIDPHKMFSGLFHKMMGCTEKLDVMLKHFLERQDSFLLNAAGAMLDEVKVVLEDAKNRRKAVIIEINGLRKHVETIPKNILYNQKQIEALQEKGGDQDEKIESFRSKNENLEANLLSYQTELERTQEELAFLKKYYIPAFEHSILALNAYLPSAKDKRVCHLVVMQDEAYRKGPGVSLRGYFGGRSMIGRDAYALIQGWPLVMEIYEEMLRARVTVAAKHDVDEIVQGLKRASEVAQPLSVMAEILCYQGKTHHLDDLFKTSAAAFGEALAENFPDEHPWYKGHGSCVHDSEIMDYYGFTGRGDEQGFENSHYVNGSLDERYRSVHNSEKKSEILLQTRESLRDQGAEQMLQEFIASRTKSTREVDDSQRVADFERRQELWAKWAGRPRPILPDDPSLPDLEPDDPSLPDLETVEASSSLEEASEGGDATNQSEEADLSEGSDDSSDSDDGDGSQDSEDRFDTDEDDEDDEDEERTLDAVNAEEDALRCRLCTDLDTPLSCDLTMKPIVECCMCLAAVPKAVYIFHLMKFHAKAPYLDEAPALFADFLPPGSDLEAYVDCSEEESGEEEGDESNHSYESEGSDEDSEEPNYDKYNCPILKGMLVERGFEEASVNKLKKAELVAALEADDRGEESDGSEAEDREEYDKYTCPILKGMLVERGFEEASVNKLRKAELVAALEADDRGEHS